MNRPDLDNLTYAELHDLYTRVSERMQEARENGITQLRATITEQAGLLGIDIKDLLPKAGKRRGRPRRSEGELA